MKLKRACCRQKKSRLISFINSRYCIVQLSDSAECDLKNFTDRGGFYPLRPIRTRGIKLSKIFKINNSRLHLPVSRHVQEITVRTYFCRCSPNSRCRSSTCIPPVLALIWGSRLGIFFPLRKTCETFRHFVLLYQHNVTLFPGLFDCTPFSGIYAACTIDFIFHISQKTSKFDQC